MELKQEVDRLSKRDRAELFVYLLRRRHETPEWRRATARRIDTVKPGNGFTLAQLEAREGLS